MQVIPMIVEIKFPRL